MHYALEHPHGLINGHYNKLIPVVSPRHAAQVKCMHRALLFPLLESLLAQGTKCVRECTPGQYYVSGKFCIPCDSNCPKGETSHTYSTPLFRLTGKAKRTCVCRRQVAENLLPSCLFFFAVCSTEKLSSLDATTLASLENCTTLSGNLIISEESYKYLLIPYSYIHQSLVRFLSAPNCQYYFSQLLQ